VEPVFCENAATIKKLERNADSMKRHFAQTKKGAWQVSGFHAADFQPSQNHGPDLGSLLKVIKGVGFNPPLRRFHEQNRIIIPVRKERIKRKAHVGSFLQYLAVANRDDLVA
jgi:hypothetical protein